MNSLGMLALPRPLLEGTLKRLSFADLLQSLSNGEPCQILLFSREHVRGFIWLDGRRVVRVQAIGSQESKAFFDLFQDGEEGGFKVFSLPREKVPPREFVGDLGELLLRAAWLVDEANKPSCVTQRLTSDQRPENQIPA